MANIFRTSPKRLGEFLVSSGIAEEKDINKALEERSQSGELLGEILVRMGSANERDIAEVISAQYSFPFIDVGQYDIAPEAFSCLDPELMEKHCLVPLDKFGDLLLVAIGGVLEQEAIEEVEKDCGCGLQVVVSTAQSVRDAIKSQSYRAKVLGGQGQRAETEESLESLDALDQDVEIELVKTSADDEDEDVELVASAEDGNEMDIDLIKPEADEVDVELVGTDEEESDKTSQDLLITKEIEKQLEEMEVMTNAGEDDRKKEDESPKKPDKAEEPKEKPKQGKIPHAQKIDPDMDFFDPNIIKPG